MKKPIYLLLFMLALITGCTKNDGPVPKSVLLDRVPEPQVVKKSGSQSIDVTDLASFKAEFEVGLYYQSGIKPAKFDVVVRKNGDTANVKVFRKDITTFPTELTITANDLETLFGTAIALGDNYDISVDIYTVSGKKYEAFPAKAAGFGSGIYQQPGATTSVRYSAICQYHDEDYQGKFKILEDEWGDYAAGDVVDVTRIDATHFSFKYAAPDALPIIITVDPLTNNISVAKQVYTPDGYGIGYGAISCESVPDQRNVVSPCDLKFGIVLKHTVSIGSFGSFYIEMQKVN